MHSHASDYALLIGPTRAGGSITISSFGGTGQQIAGSFDMKLCDASSVCAASIKTYKGTFSALHTGIIGTATKPFPVSASNLTPSITLQHGIAPATGKNYHVVTTNATGGTLTLTLTPTVDVNLAVYTDAGYSTPAGCNIPSTMNVVGAGPETCAITVTANQRIYYTVSQPAIATALETYTLKLSE